MSVLDGVSTSLDALNLTGDSSARPNRNEKELGAWAPPAREEGGEKARKFGVSQPESTHNKRKSSFPAAYPHLIICFRPP